MLPRNPGMLFLTSIPYTYGQHPWVIEIEDATTLFFPYLRNGETATVRPAASPYYPIVRSTCSRIATAAASSRHMHSTAEMLPRLFRSFADRCQDLPCAAGCQDADARCLSGQRRRAAPAVHQLLAPESRGILPAAGWKRWRRSPFCANAIRTFD